MDGSSVTTFTFSVPETEPVGTSTLVLSATFSGETITTTVTVNVIEKNEVLAWAPVTPPKAVTQGETLTVELTLQNTGNYTTTAVLGVTDEKAISSLDKATVTLAPGATTTVVLTFNIPAEFKAGDHTVQGRALYGLNNNKSATQDITITVEEKSNAGVVALSIVLFLLGLIIGAVIIFMVLRFLVPGGKKDEDEEQEEEALEGEEGAMGGPKPKRKKMKKKIAGEDDEMPPEGEDYMGPPDAGDPMLEGDGPAMLMGDVDGEMPEDMAYDDEEAMPEEELDGPELTELDEVADDEIDPDILDELEADIGALEEDPTEDDLGITLPDDVDDEL
jgi:hypothetical protein